MHMKQAMDLAKNRMDNWLKSDKEKMMIMDPVHLLSSLVDESDPDVGLPNIVHVFQTAERIRRVISDLHHPKYSTKNGIYSEGRGL